MKTRIKQTQANGTCSQKIKKQLRSTANTSLGLGAYMLLTSASALAGQHSLVIAIDGLRGDGIENAATPNIDKLINGTWASGYQGAFAHYAQTMTDAAPNSGPNHVGIMTGVTSTKSGVTGNSDVGGGRYGDYPHYQTLIENHAPSLNTAYLVTWGTDMQITNSADVKIDSDDAGNIKNAVNMLNGSYSDANWPLGSSPDAIFLFLDDVDHAGHSCCFSADDQGYTDEITSVDGQIGQLLSAIKNRPSFADEHWQIVITSDHGGRGSSHGIHAADNYTIPFLVASKAVSQGYLADIPHNYDAAPTALSHMGVAVPEHIDGKVRGSQTLAQAPRLLQQDLVTYLPFEGDYRDHSGQDLHATVGGGSPAVSSDGKFGQHLAINGNDEYLTLGKPRALDFDYDTDFTLLTWYRVSGDQFGDPVIIGNKNWNSGANRGTLLLANEGNGDDVGINLASDSGDRKDIDPIDYTFNGWWLLAASFDRDGVATLYAGSPQGRLHIIAGGIKDVGDLTSSLDWNIGQDGTGSYRYNLKADLDDMAIWRRALTLDEIRTVYNQGTGLEIKRIINNDLPVYLSSASELVANRDYNVLITANAKGTTCGLEWDADLIFNERNAKWDCAGRADPMILKVNNVQQLTNGNKQVFATLVAQNGKGALEWDADLIGGERNAKFDQNTAGDPLILNLNGDANNSTITVEIGNGACGLEWDNDLLGGERNGKWDCTPKMDPLRIELLP
ncbi:alkaline phosphatase family protein [Thalassomonas actiniarum]|uniref:Alkaline phosphatase family protein n=1 Tax=Thalassomonas actiniarum TaxID=485447 RepID=A0AAF0C6D3_9GAMM|nr:alkaline phosphatase family protein [Thalassomonas actiniarum]WDE02131.1 alkaline phosphatase family protein [Thalassomonas actiniarum]